MPCWVINLEAKLYVKGELRLKNYPYFCGKILIYGKKALYKVLRCFDQFLWSFESGMSDVMPANAQNISSMVFSFLEYFY